MELPEPELLHVQGGEAALASILHTSGTGIFRVSQKQWKQWM